MCHSLWKTVKFQGNIACEEKQNWMQSIWAANMWDTGVSNVTIKEAHQFHIYPHQVLFKSRGSCKSSSERRLDLGTSTVWNPNGDGWWCASGGPKLLSWHCCPGEPTWEFWTPLPLTWRRFERWGFRSKICWTSDGNMLKIVHMSLLSFFTVGVSVLVSPARWSIWKTSLNLSILNQVHLFNQLGCSNLENSTLGIHP
jgi:hypothetical protein